MGPAPSARPRAPTGAVAGRRPFRTEARRPRRPATPHCRRRPRRRAGRSAGRSRKPLAPSRAPPRRRRRARDSSSDDRRRSAARHAPQTARLGEVTVQTFSPLFDLPVYAGAFSLTYAIACTQRSGSTLLATSLWRRGVFGAPASYFNPEIMEHYRERHALTTDKDYLELLRARRTSPNGVFGYKILAPHFLSLLDLTPYLFGQVEPNKIIYLARRNEVAQAISLYKAEHTRSYFPEPGEVMPEVPYDFEAIERRVVWNRDCNRLWARIFQALDVTPYVLFYEDLVADLPARVEEVADFLGLGTQSQPLPYELPALRRLSNSISVSWEDRFRSDPRFAAPAETASAQRVA
ncbi:MAG: hypothetical protein E7812_00870 [Phenylobacterium sp.]|nr:MAG: hypothetical protein E7812_00870 [Phenylobacterium sp.]